MPIRNQSIIEYCSTRPWAMHEETLAQLAAIVARHTRGDRLPDDELAEVELLRAERGGADSGDMEVVGGVAVIPITGVIARHARQVNGTSQPRGTSMEALQANLNKATGDRRVHTILLRVNSPGGSVDGITEAAAAVRDAAEAKRVVAIADGNMASAAFWIGSQASRLYTTDTSAVGSIGVYQLILDDSEWHEKRGLAVHLVKSGPHKGAGAPGVPVTDEQLAAFQQNVDAFFGLFLDAVQAGRSGMSPADVRGVADGRVWIGAQAVEKGLADDVSTFDALMTQLAADPAASPAAAAASTTTGDEMSTKKDPEAAAPKQQELPTTTQAIADKGHATTAKPKEDPEPAAPAVDPEAIRQAERERIQAIQDAAFPHQAELVAKLIADGTSAGDAALALNRDMKENGPKHAAAETKATALPSTASAKGDGTQDVKVWDEAKGQYVDPNQAPEAHGAEPIGNFDFAACETEDQVTELATKEYATLDAKTKRVVAGNSEERWLRMRRGEWRQARAATAGAF